LVTRTAIEPVTGDPGLGAKVAFLSSPGNYPEATRGVDTVETHMSWVFLTERHAWKLKKPVRQPYLDFSTEAARRHFCAEEVRLNQRLSRDVYLGVVPLAVGPDGRLRIGGGGTVVDWLVKMRRLPAERMLDRVIRAGAACADDVRGVVDLLGRFYAECAPVAMPPGEYSSRFAADIAGNLRELARPEFALPIAMVEPACGRQRSFLGRAAPLLEARMRDGHVIEGHGDLRPEHVCLERDPQIIDCLEFSRDFRLLDAADELGFLALECERLGAGWMKRVVFERYAELCHDAPPPALVHFYQSHRACMRAKIAIWHLKEPERSDGGKWTAQAHEYLRLADSHSAQCG
jgi:aminoglycoside phosphotransferase family enzyme